MKNSENRFGLKGKLVVVTGAGGGIGAPIVLALRNEGCKVVCVDLKPLAESELAGVVQDEGFQYLQGDAADLDAMQAALSPYLDVYGLVNCAGLLGGDLDMEGGKNVPNLLKMFKAHVMTTFVMTNIVADKIIRAAAEANKGDKSAQKQKKGRQVGAVVNILSVETSHPAPNVSMYSAGQGGKLAMTRADAVTFGPSGIKVNGIAPGYTETEANLRRYAEMGVSGQGEMEDLGDRTLLDFAQPDEIAFWTLVLLSPFTPNTTGEIVTVDGGNTLPLISQPK